MRDEVSQVGTMMFYKKILKGKQSVFIEDLSQLWFLQQIVEAEFILNANAGKAGGNHSDPLGKGANSMFYLWHQEMSGNQEVAHHTGVKSTGHDHLSTWRHEWVVLYQV